MATPPKSKSPFYPGQPVPVELFAGRTKQIKHILERGVQQVEAGKPVAMYLQGEYGIGKSSIVGITQYIAEKQHGLHAIYAPLGGAETLDDVGAAILEATIRSGALDSTRSEKLRNAFAKYVGEQSLFGVSLHAEALKKDAPAITSGILPFLKQLIERLADTGIRGVFLALDEINGITANPKFAHFLKGIVDTNAMSNEPVPLLLMLCGVEDRRREMIRMHQPVDRIFDVIDIERMATAEMEEFFTKAFNSVQMKVEPRALDLFTEYSAGFPKIMHLIGDSAFWLDKDALIDTKEAMLAVFLAADELGKKYVDQQVYKALRSADYRSILDKIGAMGPAEMSFKKSVVGPKLSPTEKAKFNNFLQKMKKLQVLSSGDVDGEYVFNLRMVRLYIWFQSREKDNGTT